MLLVRDVLQQQSRSTLKSIFVMNESKKRTVKKSTTVFELVKQVKSTKKLSTVFYYINCKFQSSVIC
jgi:hypothetical protein